MLGGAETLAAGLRADAPRELVDLVRLLLPHLANPHNWSATFLASAASQLDQGSQFTETPGPTDDTRKATATAVAFRVEYLQDEKQECERPVRDFLGKRRQSVGAGVSVH